MLNQEVEQASASLNQLLEKTAHASTDIASMLTGVLTLGGTFVDIQGSSILRLHLPLCSTIP